METIDAKAIKPRLDYCEKWATVAPCGLPITIKNHCKDLDMYRGHGCWCYYVIVPERLCPTRFEPLWLPDKIVKYYECSPERVTHNYDHLFSDCEWHGGVTYYEKHGHAVGHRAVEIGCDYVHLWDEERGYDYTLEEILADALHTARLVGAELGLAEKTND